MTVKLKLKEAAVLDAAASFANRKLTAAALLF